MRQKHEQIRRNSLNNTPTLPKQGQSPRAETRGLLEDALGEDQEIAD
ncbi:MAG: hypothetical protein JJ895_01935 [Balneolaceae bacterium]|nr:hypothetical protein [Balneolaceae bacterium]